MATELAGGLDVPYVGEAFQFFHRTGQPSEVKAENINFIDKARLSLSYKRCLKHKVNIIFDKVVQYSNQKNILIPQIEIEKMLLECLPAATSRDVKQPDRVSIEQSIIFDAKMILTRTTGEDRERKMQRYPGYIEQQAVNVQATPDEMGEIGQPAQAKKKGLFRW